MEGARTQPAGVPVGVQVLGATGVPPAGLTARFVDTGDPACGSLWRGIDGKGRRASASNPRCSSDSTNQIKPGSDCSAGSTTGTSRASACGGAVIHEIRGQLVVDDNGSPGCWSVVGIANSQRVIGRTTRSETDRIRFGETESRLRNAEVCPGYVYPRRDSNRSTIIHSSIARSSRPFTRIGPGRRKTGSRSRRPLNSGGSTKP